jgi:hypothetical protein
MADSSALGPSPSGDLGAQILAADVGFPRPALLIAIEASGSKFDECYGEGSCIMQMGYCNATGAQSMRLVAAGCIGGLNA